MTSEVGMIRLQKLFLSVGCAALLVGCGMATRSDGRQQAAQVRAELLRPKTVEPIGAADFRSVLESHRGEVVLVNLWATWCKPCLKELPDIARVQQKYRDKKFTVIAVSFDDLEDLETKVRPFAQKQLSDFINYLQNEDDPEKFVSVMDKSWEGVVPTNFLFDRAGNLKGKLIGGKSYEEFDAAIGPLVSQ